MNVARNADEEAERDDRSDDELAPSLGIEIPFATDDVDGTAVSTTDADRYADSIDEATNSHPEPRMTRVDTPPSSPPLEDDERETLEEADVDPAAIEGKEYSYRMLLEAGLEEDVADTLRRRFSLPWSFETDGDLEGRSAAVRGLGEAERQWITASGDEDWQAFEDAESRTESGETDDAEDRTGRPYPRPTPITAVTGVGPDDAETLAAAGILSAERLSTIDAAVVARLLDLDVLHVRTWRYNARELVD